VKSTVENSSSLSARARALPCRIAAGERDPSSGDRGACVGCCAEEGSEAWADETDDEEEEEDADDDA
jgi:hypothetical protein